MAFHMLPNAKDRLQFGLMALTELVTICAIVFASSAWTGVPASIFLAGLALALFLKLGPLAIAMFAATSVAADLSIDDGLERQLWVIFIGALLCLWFRLRGRLSGVRVVAYLRK